MADWHVVLPPRDGAPGSWGHSKGWRVRTAPPLSLHAALYHHNPVLAETTASWALDVLLERLSEELCGTRAGLRGVAATSEALLNNVVADLPAGCVVALALVLTIDPATSDGAEQVLMVGCSGTYVSFWSELVQRTHVDMHANSLPGVRGFFCAVPCRSLGVLTMGMEPLVAASTTPSRGSPIVPPRMSPQLETGGWKRTLPRTSSSPEDTSLADAVTAKLQQFGDWSPEALEPFINAATDPCVEEDPSPTSRTRLPLSRTLRLVIPVAVAPAALCPAPWAPLCVSFNPIGIAMSAHRNMLVIRVRTVVHSQFECSAQPDYVVLTVRRTDDALGDSHQTKWNEFRRTPLNEVRLVYKRHVALPCLVDPASQLIRVEEDGLNLTISFAMAAGTSSSPGGAAGNASSASSSRSRRLHLSIGPKSK